MKCTTMKNELSKGKQVIDRELGKDFDLDKAIDPESGWKGRYETILAYQEKIKETEAQMAQTKTKLRVPGGPPSSNDGKIAGNQSGLGNSQISAAEQARQEFFQVKKENSELKEKLMGAESKYKGLCSRKNVLENELKMHASEHKETWAMFDQKVANDEAYIQALSAKFNKLREECSKLREEKHHVVTKVIKRDEPERPERPGSALDNEGNKIRREMAILEEEISKKDKMIADLMKEQKQKGGDFANSGAAEAIKNMRNEMELVSIENEEWTRLNGLLLRPKVPIVFRECLLK